MTLSCHCLILLLAVALLLPVPAAFAAETGAETKPPEQEKRYRWTVAAGGAVVGIDSSYKHTDKETGHSFFIDPEGQLNLSEREYVPSAYVLALIKGRHYLSAGYTRFRRTSGEQRLDESLDIGDITEADGSSLTPFEDQILELRRVVTAFETKRILPSANIYEATRHIRGAAGACSNRPQFDTVFRGPVRIDGNLQFFRRTGIDFDTGHTINGFQLGFYRVHYELAVLFDASRCSRQFLDKKPAQCLVSATATTQIDNRWIRVSGHRGWAVKPPDDFHQGGLHVRSQRELHVYPGSAIECVG